LFVSIVLCLAYSIARFTLGDAAGFVLSEAAVKTLDTRECSRAYLFVYFGLTYSIESRFIVVAVLLLLLVVVFAGEGDDVVFIRGEDDTFGEATIFPFRCSASTTFLIITGVVRPNATTVAVDFFRRPDKVTLAAFGESFTTFCVYDVFTKRTERDVSKKNRYSGAQIHIFCSPR